MKFSNTVSGFGVIEPDGGGQDAFVHISAVEREGMSVLRDGQRIQYDVVPGRDGKSEAAKLVALD